MADGFLTETPHQAACDTGPGAATEHVKISIITAVYNAEATVGGAIESVAAQRHRNIEHIVVDGASTDGTLAAIDRAAHPRMRVISEPDSGIYDAINKGISTARGDVVGLVHSDDFLADDHVLDAIATAFADPTVEALFADLDYVSKDDPARIVRHWVTGRFHQRRLNHGWMPAHPTLYLRRAVFDRIGLYDTRFRIAADYDFVLRYFSQTSVSPFYLPWTIYKMRVGGVSNRNLARLVEKSREDYRALRRNQVGGLGALAAKNLSKLPQFLGR